MCRRVLWKEMPYKRRIFQGIMQTIWRVDHGVLQLADQVLSGSVSTVPAYPDSDVFEFRYSRGQHHIVVLAPCINRIVESRHSRFRRVGGI